MESTSEIIQALADSQTVEEKRGCVERLKEIAANKKGEILIGNVRKLFEIMEKIITNSTGELIVEIVEFLTLIMCGSDGEIIEYAGKLQASLVGALGQDNMILRAAIQECELRYLKKSENSKLVLESFHKYGLESGELITRLNSAEVLALLSKQHWPLMNDSKYREEICRILHTLIERYKQKASEVERRTFERVIIQLTQSHPGIFRCSKALSPDIQAAYNEILKEGRVFIGASDPALYKQIDNALAAEISKSFKPSCAPGFPVKAPSDFRHKNNVYFEIVPERLIEDLKPTSNWKQRAGAIEELEELINNGDSLQLVQPHFKEFFEFLAGLLKDPNYKVTVTTLRIMSSVLNSSFVSPAHPVMDFLPGLVDKLGDNKIMIRQLAMQGLRGIAAIIGATTAIHTLLSYISSPKWHTREEILNFIITELLSMDEDSLSSLNYEEILGEILKLLRDDKPKVVQILYETCATFAHVAGVSRILEIIKKNSNDEEYTLLAARIEAKSLPVLGEDGVLLFPYISNELLIQNSFFSAQKSGGPSPSHPGQKSRFTSADPSRHHPDKNIFATHSASSKRPQTNEVPHFGQGNISPTFGKDENPDFYSRADESPLWLSELKQDYQSIKNKGNIQAFNIEKTSSTKPSTSESSLSGSKYLGDHLKYHKNPQKILSNVKEEDKNINEYLESITFSKGMTIGVPKPSSALRMAGKLMYDPVFRQGEASSADPHRRMTHQKEERRIHNTPSSELKPKFKEFEEVNNYLSPEEVFPLPNPEEAWKKALVEVKDHSNWILQFETCNLIRRLSVHHPEVVSSSPISLGELVVNLLKISDSMRSSLAKNGLLAFKDLLEAAKKLLDPVIESMITVIIRKGTETGSFLAAPAMNTLRAICTHCSEMKVILALMGMLGGFHKSSAQVKQRIAICLGFIIEKLKGKLISTKEGEKILMMLASLLSEGALEVRIAASNSLRIMHNQFGNMIDFERFLQRTLSEALSNKVKYALGRNPLTQGTDNIIVQNNTNFPQQSRILSSKRLKPSNKGVLRRGPALIESEGRVAGGEVQFSTSGMSITGHKSEAVPLSSKQPDFPQYIPSNIAEEPPEYEKIPIIAGSLASSDWKSRMDTIESLMNIAEVNPKLLQNSSKFVTLLETFIKGLSDGNVKVALKAVNALERFIPLFRTGVEKNLTLLLNGLCTTLCSTNTTLKNKADLLIDLLVDTVENVLLAQPFVHFALYGSARSRSTIIMHLTDILPEIHKARPALISKYVIPAAIKLMDENKADMKAAVHKLLQGLSRACGADFLAFVPSSKMDKVLSLVKA